MDTVFLIPKEGVRVMDPVTGAPLPAEGAEVVNDVYWLRRINDGDVTARVDDAPATTKKK